MSTFEIKYKMVDGTAVIYPGPYLNQLRGEWIENYCRQFIDRGIRKLVINFEETELVNSIGISLLLGVFEAMEDAAGSVVLSNLSRTNRELFETLGLLSKVELSESEEAAITRLSSAGAVGARPLH